MTKSSPKKGTQKALWGCHRLQIIEVLFFFNIRLNYFVSSNKPHLNFKLFINDTHYHVSIDPPIIHQFLEDSTGRHASSRRPFMHAFKTVKKTKILCLKNGIFFAAVFLSQENWGQALEFDPVWFFKHVPSLSLSFSCWSNTKKQAILCFLLFP